MMIDTKDTAAAPTSAESTDKELGEELANSDTENSAEAAEQPESAAASESGAAEEGAAAEAKPEQKPAKKPVPERYRHFKHMPPRSHQWIEKNCGVWVLDAMRNYLLDPDRVFPDWGTRFAVTLKDIGREEVERMGEAEVLYDYVMTSPFWEINYQIRKRLMAAKPSRKRGGKSKDGGKGRSKDQPAQTESATPVKS